MAFQGGEADAIVADWIWVARQRAEGRDFVFIPYSRAVGGVMVPADSGAEPRRPEGQQIGIAGGPLDKSWIILRAYAQQEYGFDLAAETEQVFGAPPLIFKAGLDGEDGRGDQLLALHRQEKAAGMRELISVDEATAARPRSRHAAARLLDARRDVREQPRAGRGPRRASRAAKDLLATDDAAWEGSGR